MHSCYEQLDVFGLHKTEDDSPSPDLVKSHKPHYLM